MPDNKKIDLSVFDEAVKTTPTKTKEPEIDLSVFDEEVKKKDVAFPVQGAAAKAVSVSPSSKGGKSVSAPLDEAQTAQVDQPTYMQQQLREKGLIVDEPKSDSPYTPEDLNWFKTVQSNPRSLDPSDSTQVQKYRDMTQYMRTKRERTEKPVSSLYDVKTQIEASSSFVKENENRAKVEAFRRMFPNEVSEEQNDITSLIDIQGKIAMAEAAGNHVYDKYKYAAPDMESQAAVDILTSLEDATNKVQEAKKKGVLRNIGVGTVEGVKDYFNDYLTLSSTIRNNKSVTALKDKLVRINQGTKEELTKGEASLLQALQTAEIAAKAIDKEMPEALRLGEGLGGSIGFMAEFGLTGGIGAATKKAVIKGAVQLGAKSKLAKAGVGVMSSLAKAGVQTSTMPAFYKEVSKKVSNGESPISAVGNALYETGVDVWTEGMWMGKVPTGEAAKNLATRLAYKVGNAVADEKGIKGLAVGFAKEYVEEKTAEALKGAKDIAQDKQTFDAFAAQFIDVKSNLRTAATVAVMTGVLGGSQEAIRAYAGMGLNSDIKMTGSKLPADVRSAVDDITANRDLTQKEVFDLVAQTVKGSDVENKKELLVQAANYATTKLAREAYDEVVRAKTSKVRDGEVVSEIEEPSPEMDEDQKKVDYLLKAKVPVPDGTTMEQLGVLYNETKAKEEGKPQQKQEAVVVEETKLIEINPKDAVSETVEPLSVGKAPIVPPEQKEGLKQPPKPIEQMSSEEIRSFSDEVKQHEKNIYSVVFGEQADKFKQLEQSSNNPQKSRDQSKAIDEEMQQMIDALPKEKRDIWDGEAEYDAAELRDMSRMVGLVEESENINELSSSLKNPLMTFSKNKNNKQTLAIFNAAIKKAQELGVSTEELIGKTSKLIAKEFKDPQDAMDVVKSALESIAQPSDVKQEPIKAIEATVEPIEPQTEQKGVVIPPKQKEGLKQQKEVVVAQDFKKELSTLKEEKPKDYWSVDMPTDEVIETAAKNGKIIETEGGKAVVKEDGDIIGVYSNKTKSGVFGRLINKIINAGGKKLDNFDGYLTKMYENNGFRVVAKMDFNEEYAPKDMPSSEIVKKPDVVFMVYDPKGELNIKEQRFDKESYDQAKEYRDSYLEQQKQPIVGEQQIEVTQLKEEQNGKENGQGRQGLQVEEARKKLERETKIEENKARLGRIFDNAAILTRTRSDITGEERKKVAKELARDVVDYVRTEFDLLGEALIDKVKSFVKENNIPLEDISDSDLNDVVKEKGYAGTVREKDKGNAVPQKGVVEGAQGKVSVGNDVKDQKTPRGEDKVKQRGFQTGSMEKAGGKFAEIAKEHPLFYTEKTENQQLKDAADWLDGKSEDAIMSALTTGKSGTPEQRVNRKTLYAMYLQDKLNDFVEKGMDEDANATDEALIKVTDSLANEGTEIARGLQAYAKYQRMNPNTVTWTINNRIKKENRAKFPEADIEAVADSEEDIKRMAKDLSQESLDDKRLTDIIDNIAKKNKDKKQQTYSEKAKEIADKVRKIKPSSWGLTFSDPLLAASAFNVALETTAKAIEISGNIADSIVKGVNAIKRTDWYKGLNTDQKRKAERVFEVNVKKDLGVDGLSKEQLAKYLKTEMKDLGLSLREVIKKHWTDPSSLGVTLSERIVSDLGLTQKEADLVQSTINEIIKEKLADKIDNYIFNESLPKGKAQKEIFINKMGEFLMMGNIDHQYFREAFANKFGLTPTLTKDQAKLISDLNKAVVATKDMGVFGDMAANEFAREIDKLLPKTKAEELFNGMFGLDYANALSGATTHYVNIKSVFFNLLARPFMDITRTQDWIDAIRNGNMAELPILNALNSWIDFFNSMGHGTTDFQDIMKSGDLRAMHKYISEVKSIAHLNVPELERHKTGGDRFKPIKAKVGGKEIDLNIANYMKFVGRALAAEDAFSYRGFEAVELATALRKKLRKQGLSESEIKKHIAKQVYGGQLSQAELADVEKQLEKEKEAMELFGFKTDKLKENRRRLEIVREKMLDFTEEELVNLKEVAKGNVFNDTRGGVVNSVMSALSHFANKNVFTKLLTMPHFMFFRIAGNIGDFMIDTIPGYGQARAKGWSPTTMYATYMKHKEDGMAGDKAAFKALAGERLSVSELPFKTAQLGDKGSFRQKQQMDRARIANMMMLSQIAIVAGLYAIGGDDKDENGESWFDISGGRFFDKDIYARDTKLMPTYTVKMGKWKWKYGNSPIMTFGLSVLGNYSDMVKAGKSEQEITDRLKLMTRSFMYSVGALTDQQLMQGFKSMMESGVNLVKTAQSLKAEEADQGDNPVNRVASNFAKYIAKEQLSPLTGWLPTKNNLFQQSLQSYTGTAVESKDIPAMLAYDLGIHHFTNRPALDALGNEVKRKPGYTGIYYEPAMITEDPKKWEMVRWLEQNNAYPATYYNKDERYIYAQPKSKGWFHDVFNEKKPSYEKKQPTEEEFWQMRKLSGEMIQRDLMQYKDATYDGKKIWELEAKEKTSSGKTMMQDKVADYISKAKEQTRLYLFTWGELGKTDKELYDKLYRSKVLPKYETSVNVYKKTDQGETYKDENGKDVILDRKPLMDEELSAYNREAFIAYMNSMKASKDKIGDEFKDASELAWTNATKEAAKPLGGKATGKPKRSASDILSKAR